MNFRVGIPLIQNSFNGRADWIAGYYYVKNCINALISLPEYERPEIYLFIPDDFNEPLLLPEYHHKEKELKLIKIPCNKHGQSLELQSIIDKNYCDIYFPFNTTPTFNFKSKMIGWIPDLQYKHFPEFFTAQDLEEREATTQFMLEFADNIACSSENAALDLERFYSFDKTKKLIIPFASIISNTLLKNNPHHILKKYNINKKFILLPNQFWIHKNHKLVFEAWRILKEMGHTYQLICTGGKNDYRNQHYYENLLSYIKENKLESTIKILGFINRDDQIQLFRCAAAVLQPSLFEGRNTSIEDAKALGKKLIVSDIPIHIEQCKENAFYFKKNSPEDLAHLIKNNWDALPNTLDKEAEENASINYKNDIQHFAYSLVNGFKKTYSTIHHPINKTRSTLLKLSSELQTIHAHAYARQEIIDKQITEIRKIREDYDKIITNKVHMLFKIFIYMRDYLKPRYKYYNALAKHTIKKTIFKLKQHFIFSFFRKRLNIFTNKIKIGLAEFIHPKLGELYLYKPKQLTTPKHYNIRSMPSISIVTPSFQHGKFIERTIKCILNQQYSPLEYIIQDGGSTDETVQILKRYSGSLSHWESNKDNGQSHAINLGFQRTTGEIMAYLNSDDILLPGTLHYVAKYFQSHPDVDVVYGHRILIDANDNEVGRWILPPHNSEVLQWADYIPQETLFWRRQIWDKVGGSLDENFQFAMDWDLLLRFNAVHAKFIRLPRFLGAFRVHSTQKTNNEITHIGLKEMDRLRKRIHGRDVDYKEINNAVRSYLKKHLLYHKLYRLGILRY